jgi:peptidoglycan/xylan/chitin deacetylase (PgdA/CDA1 family)
MLVPRHLVTFAAAAAAFMVPTLGGGGDVSRASSLQVMRGEPRPSAPPRAEPEPPVSLFSPGHGPHTRFRPASRPRELLLSFDDGPDLRGTPLVLDELDRRGLKAIFFVTGWRFSGQKPEDIAKRDLLRKIAAHGHLVANHTLSHHNLCRNPRETAVQIDGNTEIITRATGVRPLLFRAPYGAFCPSLGAALNARELPDIGWNLDPQDWKHPSEESVYQYLVGKMGKLEGRGILLMHDTHMASVQALPRFLDWLARQNKRAVSEGRAPVTIADYSELLPRRRLAESGLEHLVADLAADVGGPLAQLLR